MAGRRRRPKIRGPYEREQVKGLPPRYWGDFRFLGGKQEPLRAAGEQFATTDPVIAAQVFAARLTELTDGIGCGPGAARRRGTIARGVIEYLLQVRAGSQATTSWLDQVGICLQRAVAFFGADRQLGAINPRDVARWVTHLRCQDSGRGGKFRAETVRKHVQALSGLFKLAQRDGWAAQGWNPVSLLLKHERPGRDPSPNVWLAVHDAARLLEAARTYRPGNN